MSKSFHSCSCLVSLGRNWPILLPEARKLSSWHGPRLKGMLTANATVWKEAQFLKLLPFTTSRRLRMRRIWSRFGKSLASTGGRGLTASTKQLIEAWAGKRKVVCLSLIFIPSHRKFGKGGETASENGKGKTRAAGSKRKEGEAPAERNHWSWREFLMFLQETVVVNRIVACRSSGRRSFCFFSLDRGNGTNNCRWYDSLWKSML